MSQASNQMSAKLRALQYMKKYGSDAESDSVRSRLVATCDELDQLLEEVPADLRTSRPGPNRWSIQEVIDHLVLSHEPAVEQLRDMMAGSSPTDAVPADLASDDPFAVSWEDLVTRLQRCHREILETFDEACGLAARQPISATGPIMMVVKDESGARIQWLERFDWKAFVLGLRVHVLEHIHQIRRTLDAVRSSSG